MPDSKEVKSKSFLEKLIHLNIMGNVEDEETRFLSGGEKSFLNPYAHPLNVRVSGWINRHNYYRITRRLPSIFMRIASRLYSIFQWYDKDWRRNALDNVEFVLKKQLARYDKKTQFKIKKNIAYNHFRFFGRLWYEDILVFGSFKRYPHEVSRFVKGVGFENLDRAIAKNKGVILLTAHHAHHMVCTTFLGYSGYKVTQLIDVKTVPAIIRDMENAVDVIDAGELNPEAGRLMDEVLKKKGILVWLADSGYSIFPYVKFFSELCRTPPGVVVKALKFDCPVLPLWVRVHKNKSRWTVHIGEEVPLIRESSMPKRKLNLRNARIMNKALEKIIIKDLYTWSFLGVAHEMKRIKKKFTIEGLQITPNIIQDLEFYEDFIKNSYEEGRDDEKVLEIIGNLKSKISDL